MRHRPSPRLTGRRAFLAASGAALATAALSIPGLAWAQAAAVPGADQLLRRVEDYLNRVKTFSADFTQVAPGGDQSTGEVYVKRPGKLRFDYAPPSKLLLVAPGDWRLIFYDGSVKQQNVLPISQTPLGVLLEDPIRLSGDVEVTGVADEGGEFAVRLIRRANPDQGSVALVFSKEPMRLLRWAVIDPQGRTTHVLLDNLQTNVNLPNRLFRWRDPKLFGYPED